MLKLNTLKQNCQGYELPTLHPCASPKTYLMKGPLECHDDTPLQNIFNARSPSAMLTLPPQDIFNAPPHGVMMYADDAMHSNMSHNEQGMTSHDLLNTRNTTVPT